MLKKTLWYAAAVILLWSLAPIALTAYGKEKKMEMPSTMDMSKKGSQDDGQSSHDKFLTCQRLAQNISGYYGPVPDSHLPPGALHGAARGAAGGALIGVIGGSGIKTNKAAARGAAIGAIASGARRARAKSANDRKRDAYQFEVNSCMSAG